MLPTLQCHSVTALPSLELTDGTANVPTMPSCLNQVDETFHSFITSLPAHHSIPLKWYETSVDCRPSSHPHSQSFLHSTPTQITWQSQETGKSHRQWSIDAVPELKNKSIRDACWTRFPTSLQKTFNSPTFESALCLLIENEIRIYYTFGKSYIATLPFRATALFPLSVGLLIQRESELMENEANQAHHFTLIYPLLEVIPLIHASHAPLSRTLSHRDHFIDQDKNSTSNTFTIYAPTFDSFSPNQCLQYASHQNIQSNYLSVIQPTGHFVYPDGILQSLSLSKLYFILRDSKSNYQSIWKIKDPEWTGLWMKPLENREESIQRRETLIGRNASSWSLSPIVPELKSESTNAIHPSLSSQVSLIWCNESSQEMNLYLLEKEKLEMILMKEKTSLLAVRVHETTEQEENVTIPSRQVPKPFEKSIVSEQCESVAVMEHLSWLLLDKQGHVTFYQKLEACYRITFPSLVERPLSLSDALPPQVTLQCFSGHYRINLSDLFETNTQSIWIKQFWQICRQHLPLQEVAHLFSASQGNVSLEMIRSSSYHEKLYEIVYWIKEECQLWIDREEDALKLDSLLTSFQRILQYPSVYDWLHQALSDSVPQFTLPHFDCLMAIKSIQELFPLQSSLETVKRLVSLKDFCLEALIPPIQVPLLECLYDCRKSALASWPARVLSYIGTFHIYKNKYLSLIGREDCLMDGKECELPISLFPDTRLQEVRQMLQTQHPISLEMSPDEDQQVYLHHLSCRHTAQWMGQGLLYFNQGSTEPILVMQALKDEETVSACFVPSKLAISYQGTVSPYLSYQRGVSLALTMQEKENAETDFDNDILSTHKPHLALDRITPCAALAGYLWGLALRNQFPTQPTSLYPLLVSQHSLVTLNILLGIGMMRLDRMRGLLYYHLMQQEENQLHQTGQIQVPNVLQWAACWSLLWMGQGAPVIQEKCVFWLQQNTVYPLSSYVVMSVLLGMALSHRQEKDSSLISWLWLNCSKLPGLIIAWMLMTVAKQEQHDSIALAKIVDWSEMAPDQILLYHFCTTWMQLKQGLVLTDEKLSLSEMKSLFLNGIKEKPLIYHAAMTGVLYALALNATSSQNEILTLLLLEWEQYLMKSSPSPIASELTEKWNVSMNRRYACFTLLLCSLVMAGSGYLPVLRRLRCWHGRLAQKQLLHRDIHQAMGYLFMGQGKLTVHPHSWLPLFLATLPCWDEDLNHPAVPLLEAWRSLWVQAKDTSRFICCMEKSTVSSNEPFQVKLVFRDENESSKIVSVPCLLPLNVDYIEFKHPSYWPRQWKVSSTMASFDCLPRNGLLWIKKQGKQDWDEDRDAAELLLSTPTSVFIPLAANHALQFSCPRLYQVLIYLKCHKSRDFIKQQCTLLWQFYDRKKDLPLMPLVFLSSL